MKVVAWSGTALVAVLALLLVLLLNFDWNQARPWINKRVTDSTGRPFAINGDLSVQWQRPQVAESGWRGWIPWPHVTAHDVTFANPDWVTTAPNMAEVKQVSFSLAPLALLRHEISVANLRIDDAQLLLQRETEDKNNWTLDTSKTPSSWEFEFNQLAINNGKVHLVDAIKKADVNADIDTLSETQDSHFRIGWTLKGSFNHEQVSGKGKAGGVLLLNQQAIPFPLQADLHVGKTAITVDGTLTRPRKLAALDLRMKVSAASMAHLFQLTGITLPETPPFATEGHLTGTLNEMGGDWTYEKFTGTMGSSDISGTLQYFSRQPRPLLKGKVASNLLQFQDLAPLIGADSPASKVKRQADIRQPADKVLPVEPFKTERWMSIDTDVEFTGRRIVRKKELPVENLETRIQLQEGVVSLVPLNFGVAGGQMQSNVKLDGRNQTIKGQIKVAARHLKLKQLFPTFQPMQTSLGEINGDASLSAVGNSVSSLLASSNGEIKAVINQGTISKLLLEQMGLNIANVVVTQLFGDRQVKLNCLASDFKVTNGLMETRTFVVDTEDATLYINGQINMAQEQLNLTIKPDSKGVRVVSLRTPLYVTGPFMKPKVNVDKGVLAMKAGSAVLLGVLAPVATALLPLVNMGPEGQSECANLLTQAGKKPVAPAPGKTAAK